MTMWPGEFEMEGVMIKQPELRKAVNDNDYDACREILDSIPRKEDRVWICNQPDKNGSTILFTACWNGKLDIVKLLVDCGAKVNWRNHRHNTALHMAVEKNHVKIAELLLQSGAEFYPDIVDDIRKRSKRDISPAMDKLFLEFQYHNPATIKHDLGWAVLRGDEDRVRQLLAEKDSKAYLEESDEEGSTVLFTACAKGYLGIVQALVEAKADIDHENQGEKNALTMAIANNHLNVVQYLLDNNANTAGIRMSTIRYWSPSNISKRIDNLLKKYPPKKNVESKQKSILEMLPPVELDEYQQLFNFYDQDKDGYISFDDLRDKLQLDKTRVTNMMRIASSDEKTGRVSFEDFVRVIKSEPRPKRKHHFSLSSLVTPLSRRVQRQYDVTTSRTSSIVRV